jgi:hypothetical protein
MVPFVFVTHSFLAHFPLILLSRISDLRDPVVFYREPWYARRHEPIRQYNILDLVGCPIVYVNLFNISLTNLRCSMMLA